MTDKILSTSENQWQPTVPDSVPNTIDPAVPESVPSVPNTDGVLSQALAWLAANDTTGLSIRDMAKLARVGKSTMQRARSQRAKS